MKGGRSETVLSTDRLQRVRSAIKPSCIVHSCWRACVMLCPARHSLVARQSHAGGMLTHTSTG